MREIHTQEIIHNVAKLCISAAQELSEDVKNAFSKAYVQETSMLGKSIISQLIENSQIAQRKKIPICQDTGLCVVFVEIGQEIHIKGGLLSEAIQKGVAQGYTQGYLRKSIVSDPLFERKNTQDNTPAVIHYDITEGDRLKITLAPKGFGSENKSSLAMLTPAQGVDGLKELFIQTLQNAGPNSCPPLLVGIGIGGSMEKCAILAKKAAIREIGSHNSHPKYA
ncbi:fumarate hydratase subunit A [Helicobacter cholecystus]|nr:fumarate hydratase subunit A [Helicobacter cholecystus]